MKQFLFSVFFLSISNMGLSQMLNSKGYDLYMYDYKTVNPAFTGLVGEQRYTFNTSIRKSNLLDQVYFPEVQLAYENRIAKLNSGIGFMIYSVKLGSLSDTYLSLLYNYQFELDEKSTLIVGTEIKHINSVIDFNNYRPNDPNDPLLLQGAYKRFKFDLDIGISYQLKDLTIGLSVKSITEPEMNYGSNIVRRAAERMMSALIAYDVHVAEWIEFKPSLFYLNNGSNNSFDINGNLNIANWVLLGVQFKPSKDFDDQLSINLGFDIKEIFEIVGTIYNSKNTDFNGNTYEIVALIKLYN